MKILMVTPQPFFEPRGTPISVYQRAQGLSNLGYKVDILTHHIGEDVEIPGVTIHRTPPLPFIRQLKVGPSLAKLPLDILIFLKSLWMLLRNHYDVIHSHEEAAYFSLFLAKLFRIPHIYDMHSSLPMQMNNFGYGKYKPVIRIFEFLEKWTIQNSDVTITIGPDLEQKAKSIHPLAKQVLIENQPVLQKTDGLEAESLEMMKRKLGFDGRTILVYTGTFEQYQGIDLLIDSARLVKDTCPDVVFLLVGGKAEQVKRYHKKVSELGLNNWIKFLGTVPISATNQYIEMADILVSPRIKGTSVPLKIYTYLHAGKPIVATNLTTHTMVLDDNTAILVEPNAFDFAQGLLKAIQDADLRQELARQAKRVARERYDGATYLAKLSQAYQLAILPNKMTERQSPSLGEG